ncbi:MAG: class I SAM-dependent RNA methyltransferase [Desulfobulbus sp.]|jgi:23S rRNA (uracil1939-C5)-methyltransferase|uniref:class I SAM-dependent RNA methyltransferase n=1 Tax=Desulfobulbus sp. TaxID=895 RepID=UPI002847C923|nr:class I SAM-dependent RNA methyltransferase [Desulfobulbus sp.]MDR2550184.1 class I SAM-dependent RNA methyltransferase [Desulfobulbus sp.]
MEHTLTIKKVIAGGKGLGTLSDGMVAMVPATLPGETVTVRESKSHRGYLEAHLVRILEASPDRVEPPCPYYGRCGGCDLQHAAYPAQLELKRLILRESLARVRLEEPPEHPALASPLAFGYRSRLRLHLDRSGRLGFHAHASNTVVPVDRCLLAAEPINRVLAALVEGGWPARLAPEIAAIELIHSPADATVAMVLTPRPRQRPRQAPRLLDALRALADAVLLAGGPAPVVFGQDFAPGGLGYRLCWDHRCFFQVNSRQNAQLVATVLEFLPVPARTTVLDLYCGMGNFSIPLALAGLEVTGVEQNRASIHWARVNSRVAGLDSTRFAADEVERYLHALIDAGARFDTVLLDPPRQGAGKAAPLLPLVQPSNILSISCDPATLARDLAQIVAHGYQVTRLIPVDMFPQTHHIESLALLERI